MAADCLEELIANGLEAAMQKFHGNNRVRSMLENAGHSVMDAASGGEGMNKLIASQPQCLVLDMIMPGMDGFKEEVPQVLFGLRCRG